MSKVKVYVQNLDEQYWLYLVMALIQSARNMNKDLYRETKSEIKFLSEKSPEASKFFTKAFSRIVV